MFLTVSRDCIGNLAFIFSSRYHIKNSSLQRRDVHDRCSAPARDITLRKRNEETIRNLEVQAALSQMVSYVAYEINKPLANIKKFSYFY